MLLDKNAPQKLSPQETSVSEELNFARDFLLEHAKRYGRSVYEQDGTVYVGNEITVSQDDIVLEFGRTTYPDACVVIKGMKPDSDTL